MWGEYYQDSSNRAIGSAFTFIVSLTRCIHARIQIIPAGGGGEFMRGSRTFRHVWEGGGFLTSTFIVINVFHRGSYGSHSISNWSPYQNFYSHV